jgi:sulfofructose kinase
VGAATVGLQVARQRDIATIADPGSLRAGAEPWPQWLDSVVATPRWLAARYPEARSLSQAVEHLSSDAGVKTLCGVTLGEGGGIALRDGVRYAWRARKTGAVDTTAAGDAFHAGLADGLVQGMETQAALDWAATLAAAVCRAPGNVALPRDRDQLALWHGRWGHRPEMNAELLDRHPAEV